jgi:tetratricopeptide (TPR) repeat protein
MRSDKPANNDDQAIRGCTEILDAGGDSPQNLAIATHYRGLAYLSKGDYRHAIEDLGELLRANPADIEVLNSRATALAASGDYAAAIRDADQAIRLRSDDFRGWYNRGTGYAQLGEYDRGIKDLDEAIRLKGDFAPAFSNRCWTRAIANISLDKALSDCNESLRLTNGDQHTLDSRAFLYLRMTRYADAIDDCNHVLNISPKLASCLYVRGLARKRVGESAKGEADIASAHALDSNLSATYARYGVSP